MENTQEEFGSETLKQDLRYVSKEAFIAIWNSAMGLLNLAADGNNRPTKEATAEDITWFLNDYDGYRPDYGLGYIRILTADGMIEEIDKKYSITVGYFLVLWYRLELWKYVDDIDIYSLNWTPLFRLIDRPIYKGMNFRSLIYQIYDTRTEATKMFG